MRPHGHKRECVSGILPNTFKPRKVRYTPLVPARPPCADTPAKIGGGGVHRVVQNAISIIQHTIDNAMQRSYFPAYFDGYCGPGELLAMLKMINTETKPSADPAPFHDLFWPSEDLPVLSIDPIQCTMSSRLSNPCGWCRAY